MPYFFCLSLLVNDGVLFEFSVHQSNIWFPYLYIVSKNMFIIGHLLSYTGLLGTGFVMSVSIAVCQDVCLIACGRTVSKIP